MMVGFPGSVICPILPDQSPCLLEGRGRMEYCHAEPVRSDQGKLRELSQDPAFDAGVGVR
jgi:hypothetical protein